MAVSRLPVISSKRTFHYLWICSVMTCFALIHQVLADDVITASPIFLNTNDDSSSDKGVLIIGISTFCGLFFILLFLNLLKCFL